MKRLLRISCMTACALAVMLIPIPAYAWKYIIILEDGIVPVAMLSANGRHVEVAIEGETAEPVRGQRTRTQVFVWQSETGALASGGTRSPVNVDLDDVPDRLVHSVDTHAAGRNRFIEGWAEVTYVAEEIQNGKVIRTWSRTRDVLLLYDP